jgi:hypothetical protein
VVELATAQRDLNGLAGRDVGRRRLQLLVDWSNEAAAIIGYLLNEGGCIRLLIEWGGLRSVIDWLRRLQLMIVVNWLR